MMTREEWQHQLNQELHEVMECGELNALEKDVLTADILKSIRYLNEREEDHAEN